MNKNKNCIPTSNGKTESIIVPKGVGSSVCIALIHATDPTIKPNVDRSNPNINPILPIEKSLKK